ncbi:MAG TPA: hypothetical protein VM716_07560 [Gemmatimonadales bacterium]|nr:hypothetical protein [Gemmatimonadales bacterium]
MHARHPILLLALALPACHRGAPRPVTPRAEVAVTVDNQNFLDMDVFLISTGGQRIRLGMVPGLSKAILMVRPELIGFGTDVRFEIHPIGGRGNSFSETIPVSPGDVIQLIIPPH